MNQVPEPSRESQDDHVPSLLARDLAELYRRDITVPREIDDAVLWAARGRFARERRMYMLLRWGGGVAAAAAIILLGLGLWRAGSTSQAPVAIVRFEPRDPQDINLDGQVDILDAFLLAKRIQSTATQDVVYDVNHDGQVDQEDARTIAISAVHIGRGVVQ